MSIDQLTGGNIEPRGLEEEMRSSYLDYAMSVIVGRALPDVRDGLKPVHRRILYSMFDSGLQPTRPHRKCDEHPSRRRPVEKRAQQLDRRRIRPVDVVEHQHDRLALRERLEQRAHRAVASIPLVLDRRSVPGRQAGQ